MKRYSGKSVLNGIAIGKIYLYQKKSYQTEKKAVTDVAGEKQRFEEAIKIAEKQLAALFEDAVKSTGQGQAAIFDIHKMMLADEDYLTAVTDTIEEGWNAEYAVDMAEKHFGAIFASMDDEYMKARAADIKDVSMRLLAILTGEGMEEIETDEPVIVVADDLSPSETIKMDKSKILAFVTAKGSANSHTAILARSMNIPSLVNTPIELTAEMDGKMAVVDGMSGELLVEPEDTVLDEYRKRREKWLHEQEELKLLKGKENMTKDGRKIDIFANIGNVEDAEAALEADAGGIGLFRSEFLYLGKDRLPTEEEQFESYKAVLKKMKDKKVVIRTLDIGADKKVDYLGLEAEDNPALGYRAIRICLDKTDIFRTQLRAIYRASAYGNVALMFPLIVSVAEIRQAKTIAMDVQKELREQGQKIGKVELGIMIETPAAAVISDELAKEVDFFSIGTNDLTQYTLAVDRQNPKLENVCDSYHPAVLKLIEMTVKNAHKAGIWVGICGELAADTNMTRIFVDMGVDELSVSPALVLKVRKTVQEIAK